MVKEQVLDMLEEICEDDVVREDLDINMKEEGLMDSLAFEEIDTPNKVISYIENRK